MSCATIDKVVIIYTSLVFVSSMSPCKMAMSRPTSFAELPVELRLRILEISSLFSFRDLIRRHNSRSLYVPRVMKPDKFGGWHWCTARLSTEGSWTSLVRVWAREDSVFTHYTIRNEYAYHTPAERRYIFESLVEDTDMAARCAAKSHPGGFTMVHVNWHRDGHWRNPDTRCLTQRSTSSENDILYCCCKS